MDFGKFGQSQASGFPVTGLSAKTQNILYKRICQNVKLFHENCTQ